VSLALVRAIPQPVDSAGLDPATVERCRDGDGGGKGIQRRSVEPTIVAAAASSGATGVVAAACLTNASEQRSG